jgi:glutamate-1-semialdehyde aminotransferase
MSTTMEPVIESAACGDECACGSGCPAGICKGDAGTSLSHWPDSAHWEASRQKLISEPAYSVRPEALAEAMQYFETRCQASKRSTDAAKECIPGGVQHNLAFNHPFPLDIRKAEGAYLWDADGNRYIDFLQAGGPTVLGSNYAPVRDKIIEVIHSAGPVTGLFHEYEYKLAELICRLIPSVEMFRMLGSGTEACMAAIRAARNVTGKKKIIKVGAGYHGWSDQMVYSTRIPGTKTHEAVGIPEEALMHTQEIYPNDIDGPDGLAALLERNKTQGGTAALIVEPFGPESATRPVTEDFNQRARELCTQYGALLIFDEVVTAFRTGMHGAQAYFGVTPDLTVFGKCVAGGYPAAGGVGGRKDIMQTFSAGIGSGSERTPRGRHALGQSAELRGGLLLPAGDGAHARALPCRARGGPPGGQAQREHRRVWPPLLRGEPRLDHPPRNARRAAGGRDGSGLLHEGVPAETCGAGHRRGVHCRGHHHPGRQPPLYQHGGHGRRHRRRGRALPPRAEHDGTSTVRVTGEFYHRGTEFTEKREKDRSRIFYREDTKGTKEDRKRIGFSNSVTLNLFPYTTKHEIETGKLRLR